MHHQDQTTYEAHWGACLWRQIDVYLSPSAHSPPLLLPGLGKENGMEWKKKGGWEWSNGLEQLQWSVSVAHHSTLPATSLPFFNPGTGGSKVIYHHIKGDSIWHLTSDTRKSRADPGSRWTPSCRISDSRVGSSDRSFPVWDLLPARAGCLLITGLTQYKLASYISAQFSSCLNCFDTKYKIISLFFPGGVTHELQQHEREKPDILRCILKPQDRFLPNQWYWLEIEHTFS